MKHHSPTPLSEIEKQSFAFPKPKKVVKIKKVLKRVGDRKKRRIAKYGTETELFRKLWNKRLHICDDCLVHLPEYSHHLFHHIRGKGMNEALRYDEDNIVLLCPQCHHNRHAKGKQIASAE